MTELSAKPTADLKASSEGWSSPAGPEEALEQPFHFLMSEPCAPPFLPAVPGERVRLRGETVSFASLIPRYGPERVSKLLDVFTRAYLRGEFKQVCAHGRSLRTFLEFVEQQTHIGNPKCQAFHNALIEDGEVPAAAILDAYLECVAFVADIQSTVVVPTSNYSTRRSFISTLRCVLKALANERYWPSLPQKLSVSIGARREGVSWASLGELTGNDLDDPNGTDGNLTSSVMRKNQSRASGMRRRLIEIFLEEFGAFKEGQRLLSLPGLPEKAEIVAAVEQLRSHGRVSNPAQILAHPLVEYCFPSADVERSKAALMMYLATVDEQVTGERRDWSSPWRSLVEKCGGLPALLRGLGPTGRSFAAAHSLVLLDSGFNVQPCDDLLANPFLLPAARSEQRLVTVTSWKARSKGKPIVGILERWEASVPLRRSDQALSTVDVIKHWQAMTEPLRRTAEEAQNPAAKYLWILPKHDQRWVAQRPAPFGAWEALRKELSLVPELRGLKIRRPNLRSTWFQLKIYDADLDVAVGALLLNHGSMSTTAHKYLNKGWFYAEMDELIRRFQHLFEARLVDLGVAPRLELSEAQLADRKVEAISMGLGFACADPLSGHQPESAAGQLCVAVDKCAECTLLRFVPSEEGYRALALTDMSLDESAETFYAQAPELWARAWLPLHALCKATISRLIETHRADAFSRAAADVREAVASGSLTLLRPW